MGKKEKATPKTRKLRILTSAYNDIDTIVDFIAFNNQQPLNAIKVSEKIFSTIENIAANPFAYKECEQILTKTKIYRRAMCLSWLIIYKITNTEILILGVIHGARSRSKVSKLRKIK